MNIKIVSHFMPWEIDHALLIFDKLKQSSYFISQEDTLYLDTALNLSSEFVDWEQSKLPKEYFIKKYKMLDNLIKSKFIHKSFIYEGDEKYGCINLLKNAVESHIDYYIHICPDVNFQEHLLYYLVESAKQIKDEYFVLTPQIYKCWDSSWDILVNSIFMDIKCENYLNEDIHEIRHKCLSLDPPSVKHISQFKYAGWFDLYSKNFIEKLVPIPSDWEGYLPWDLYSSIICNISKNNGVNVNQYCLENQIIWFQDAGCWNNDGKDGEMKQLIQNLLSIKTIGREQREKIDNNLNKYIQAWIIYANKQNIIN
jgi:hypothetical protein